MKITNGIKIIQTTDRGIKDLETAWNKLIDAYKISKTKELRHQLYKLVDPIFKKSSIGDSFHSAEDIYQEKMLALFTLLEDLDNYPNHFQCFLKIVDKKFKTATTKTKSTKPQKSTSKNSVFDKISESQILQPLSSPSNEKRLADRDKIEGLKIPQDRLQMIKEYFGIEGAKKTYKEIGEKSGISKTTVRNKIQSTIFNEQMKYGGLTQEDSILFEEFKTQILEKYIPKEDLDKTAQEVISKNIILLHHPLEKTKENIFGLIKRFEKEKLTPKEYILAATKLPTLFSLTPQHIEKNIRLLVERFKNEGLTTRKYLNAALKRPILFSMNADTVENNIRSFVEMHKADGITTEQYIKAAIKQPALFYYSPQTIETRLQETIKIFQNDGLTMQRYLKAVLNTPVLLSLSPQTIERNVKTLVDRFKNEGLTVPAYIKATMNAPALLYSSADTIEKRIRGFVEHYAKEGITIQNYLQTCLWTPILMMRAPESLSQNIDTIVNTFKQDGLRASDYLKLITKRPRLLNTSVAKITRDIKRLKFKQQTKPQQEPPKSFFDGILSLIGSSDDTINLQTLLQLMFETKTPKGISNKKIKETLPAYLKAHPEQTYDIKIPNNEMAQSFVDFVENYSNKILGKNVFNIEIV